MSHTIVTLTCIYSLLYVEVSLYYFATIDHDSSSLSRRQGPEEQDSCQKLDRSLVASLSIAAVVLLHKVVQLELRESFIFNYN